MEDNTPYRLSRIQAEGWNAARGFLHDDLDAAGIAALNPYRGDQQMARWTVGFNDALAKMGTT